MSQHTDHELLELAAKAVGFYHDRTIFPDDGSLYGCYLSDGQQTKYRWNPLLNSGQAFELEVKLLFSVTTFKDAIGIGYSRADKGYYFEEPIHGSPIHAARRAIVRAAAEIGKLL